MARCAIGLACLLLAPLASRTAWASDVLHYELRAADVVMDISAPRPDVLRIRAGQGSLPEDASWAVAAGVRTSTVPLTMHETSDQVALATGKVQPPPVAQR